ncbi:hypothetical protein L9F63_027909, partial [Diploptera punctata]
LQTVDKVPESEKLQNRNSSLREIENETSGKREYSEDNKKSSQEKCLRAFWRLS